MAPILRHLSSLYMIALSLVAVNLISFGARSADRPNVILCMADDQGWGDVGYYGHPVLKTPSLDAMAAAGLRFDRFYAAAPVCSPTRGSVMTGRTPNRFGCFKWGHSLRPQEITVAEALRTAGYVCGHFGKWHLGSVLKGSPVNPGASGFDHWLSAFNFFDLDPVLSREGVAVEMHGDSSNVAADAALEFIRAQTAAKKPFLAVVWFGSPHAPHRASAADAAVYAGRTDKEQNYYGEITEIDRAVGRLRAELRTLGIHQNTLFWYCSDNGGQGPLSVKGGRGAKGQIYEGGLRVPGILEWPAGVPSPRITNVPCYTADIYPTLLDLVGAKIDRQPPLDGISLAELIGGKMTVRPKPIGFWDYAIGGIGTPSDKWMKELLAMQKEGREMTDPERLRPDAAEITKQYPEDEFPGHSAWLDWPWKLHRIEKNRKAVQWELYNLAQDAEEKTDLAAQETQRTRQMRTQLKAWLTSVVRSLNGKDYP